MQRTIQPIEFIEDCLEVMAGLRLPDHKFKINPPDIMLLQSLARQTFKGTALTDRQYNLLKEKLEAHEDQFKEFGINLSTNLRMPLRSIDRSKWIKLVTVDQDLLLEVRFVFNKKYIEKINYLKRHVNSHTYNPLSKTHLFTVDELTIYKVISAFEDCTFDIDETLLEYYKKVKSMMEHKDDYIPGIYSYKLKNLNESSIEYIISSYGNPSVKNLYMFNDRKNLLGLKHFDQLELEESLNQLTPLSKKIIQRKGPRIFIDSTQYNINRLVESLLELNRYPILFVLPDKEPLESLHTSVSSFKNIFDSSSISVLFRLENYNGNVNEFNQYIKDNDLNSPLDTTTKIVYISENKIPKPLLKSNWRPEVVVCLVENRVNQKIMALLNEYDLTIFYHNYNSLINQYRNGVEQIG